MPLSTIQIRSFSRHFISLLYIALIVGLGSGCKKEGISESDTTAMLSPTEEYLIEISLGSEFGGTSSVIRKWNKNIQIYLMHPDESALVAEFENIIQEINALSSSIKLHRTEQESAADFFILFTDGAEYAAFEPNASDFVVHNRGLVWIYWNGQSEITHGSMYVDVRKVLDEDCRKHLLREELTQGLGLLNDSFKYPTSIFQQNWTCTPFYADIDRELLEIFLRSEVKPGMNRETLTAVFERE